MNTGYVEVCLKLLFLSLFFALVVFALDFDDAHSLRSRLDPTMLTYEGIEASMVGPCIKGTDRSPFELTTGFLAPIPIDLCVVYIVKDERLIQPLRKEYRKLGIKSSVAVRFQLK